jgi:putative transcriptional regulator
MVSVRINLAVLLAKRKWSIMDLHRVTGIRYNTLNDLYHEMALGIKFEHLQLICDALECRVSDLIKYSTKK